ncbi:MAG: SGNH/GDSL hydrolase family protein [Terriglobales bacterium]
MKLILVLAGSLVLMGGAMAQEQAADPCAAVKESLQAAQTTLRDWPNLARFRDEDAKLGAPAKGEARVVFMGDSITESWALADSFPGKGYVNRGISGQTTSQMLVRFRQDVIGLQAKVVVILAGTNDIAENTGPISVEGIEGNMASMVDLAKRNGIRVVLASVLPVQQYPWRPEIAPVEKIRALNDWMKDYAAKEGLIYLDYFSATVNEKLGMKAELSEDGVHPNKPGYAVMAPLAEKAIAAALKKK